MADRRERPTCRTYEVDGAPVVVRGNRELDEQDQAALAELVRAAKRKMVAEERCKRTELIVTQCGCPQHRSGFTPQEEADTLADASGRWHAGQIPRTLRGVRRAVRGRNKDPPRPDRTAVGRRVLRRGRLVTAAGPSSCPNTPQCEHPAWIHDIDSYDEPRPMCCADGCNCGDQHRR